MSDTQQTQLPNVENAHAVIMEGVHKRAFLHKMSQHGHNPQTAEEADHLVQLGFKVAAAVEQQGGDPFNDPAGAKTAAAGPYAQLDQAFDSHFGGQDSPVQEKTASAEAEDAAWNLFQDPDIYNSALSLKTAEAQMLATMQQEGEGSKEGQKEERSNRL